MWVEFIGFLAAFLSTAAFVPQAYKIYKEKTAKGVSLTMYLVMLSGVLSWEVYGLMIGKWPVILANLISASILLFIIYVKIKYKDLWWATTYF